jgi:hypothetical protein
MGVLCYVRASKQETHGIMRCYKVCVMVQAVGRRPVTAESRVRLQSSPCEICGEQSGNGTCFSPTTSVFPYRYHTKNDPYSSYMSFVPEGQTGEASKPPKNNALSEMGGHWTEKHCHVFQSIRFVKHQSK